MFYQDRVGLGSGSLQDPAILKYTDSPRHPVTCSMSVAVAKNGIPQHFVSTWTCGIHHRTETPLDIQGMRRPSTPVERLRRISR